MFTESSNVLLSCYVTLNENKRANAVAPHVIHEVPCWTVPTVHIGIHSSVDFLHTYTRPSLQFSLILLSSVNMILPHSSTVMPLCSWAHCTPSFVDFANKRLLSCCSSSESQVFQSSWSCSLTECLARCLAPIL